MSQQAVAELNRIVRSILSARHGHPAPVAGSADDGR
jgi:hypothetical protein